MYNHKDERVGGKGKKGLTTELVIINTENYISTPNELKIFFLPK